MKKFLLYGHGGSYNHGGEAIIRSTMDMIRSEYDNFRIILSTHFKEQDIEFTLPVDDLLERDCIALEREKESGNQGAYICEVYKDTLDAIDKDTICLSVGGDNYCYPNWIKWKDIHNKALEVGAKSILWSCSIEPDMIDEGMLSVLKTHHLITARESITYNALLDRGLKNVKLVADVAFLLETEPIVLPSNFISGNTVAINASPLTARKETSKHILKQNILRLIEFILNSTDMAIALIPHVTMPMDNDFAYLQEVYKEIKEKSRVSLIGTNYNAKQLKYVISQCRFGVFARTHASIAAYSTCVPSIAIGYSVKAQGIAEDLKMQNYVLSITDITDITTLMEMFKSICKEENEIRLNLDNLNPKIKRRAQFNITSLKDILSERRKINE